MERLRFDRSLELGLNLGQKLRFLGKKRGVFGWSIEGRRRVSLETTEIGSRFFRAGAALLQEKESFDGGRLRLSTQSFLGACFS